MKLYEVCNLPQGASLLLGITTGNSPLHTPQCHPFGVKAVSSHSEASRWAVQQCKRAQLGGKQPTAATPHRRGATCCLMSSCFTNQPLLASLQAPDAKMTNLAARSASYAPWRLMAFMCMLLVALAFVEYRSGALWAMTCDGLFQEPVLTGRPAAHQPTNQSAAIRPHALPAGWAAKVCGCSNLHPVAQNATGWVEVAKNSSACDEAAKRTSGQVDKPPPSKNTIIRNSSASETIRDLLADSHDFFLSDEDVQRGIVREGTFAAMHCHSARGQPPTSPHHTTPLIPAGIPWQWCPPPCGSGQVDSGRACPCRPCGRQHHVWFRGNNPPGCLWRPLFSLDQHHLAITTAPLDQRRAACDNLSSICVVRKHVGSAGAPRPCCLAGGLVMWGLCSCNVPSFLMQDADIVVLEFTFNDNQQQNVTLLSPARAAYEQVGRLAALANGCVSSLQ